MDAKSAREKAVLKKEEVISEAVTRRIVVLEKVLNSRVEEGEFDCKSDFGQEDRYSKEILLEIKSRIIEHFTKEGFACRYEKTMCFVEW